MRGLTTYNSVNLVQRVVVHHVVRVAQLDQRVFDLKTTQLIADYTADNILHLDLHYMCHVDSAL